MKYKIIAAMCRNNGIGYNNTLPWNIKEELHHFSKLTKGNGKNAIVMGKNTWKSIGYKPLPKRDNYILSTTLNLNTFTLNQQQLDRTFICKDIDELEMKCGEKNYENIWIIGGESIYKQFLEKNHTNECIITFIDSDFQCDTFFPNLSDSGWNISKTEHLDNSTEHNVTINHFVKCI